MYFTEEYEKFFGPFVAALDGVPALLSPEVCYWKTQSAGSYEANTNLKPWAIRRLLEQAQCAFGDGVWIYSDIDCEWVGLPVDFPGGNWDVGLVRNPNRTHKMKWGAQLLVFNWTHPDNKYRILSFLDEWEKRCDAQPDHTDHKFMLETIHNQWGSTHFADFSSILSGLQIVDGLDETKEHKPS